MQFMEIETSIKPDNFISLHQRVGFYEVTGGRALSFRDVSMRETAGPNMLGKWGGGKTPP